MNYPTIRIFKYLDVGMGKVSLIKAYKPYKTDSEFFVFFFAKGTKKIIPIAHWYVEMFEVTVLLTPAWESSA